MPLHLPPSLRLVARRVALPWLVAAAWLAAPRSAAGQQDHHARTPRPGADAVGRRFPVDEWARLSNGTETAREIAARYPPALRDSPVPGQALLRFRISSDGGVDPASISVVRTSNPAFAAPAVEVARRLRFIAAMAGGRRVPIWTERTVYFNLPSGFSGTGRAGPYQEPTLQNPDEVRRQVALWYPRAQRDSGIAGSVLLKFDVSNDGTVDSASISMEQATDTAFVEPAKLVVQQMRFAPAKVGDRPVRARVTLPVHFTSGMPRDAVSANNPFIPSDQPIAGTLTVPPEERTYEFSAVEEQPLLLNPDEVAREMMERPASLRDSNVTGQVEVRFRILADGTVDSASVTVASATRAEFVGPAISAVRHMRFTPGKVGGRPVKVWVTVPVRFTFEGSPPARRDSTRTDAATPPAGGRP